MPAKFDRCVRKVKTAGKVDNPYAICNASLKKGKMKEMKTLDRMKHKIVESLTNRVEEGFARELGRGLGGAYRIIRGGVTKTADAMARSGQKGLESGGWKGAFGGMAKEGLKGLASGGSKLATGAAKTGISLLKSVGELSPQQKRGVVAAYRGKRDQEGNAPVAPTTAPTPTGPGTRMTPEQIAKKKAEFAQKNAQTTSDKLTQSGAYGSSAKSVFTGKGRFTPTSSLKRRTTLDDESRSNLADYGSTSTQSDPLGFKRGEKGSLLGQQAGAIAASRRDEPGQRGNFNIGRFRRKYANRFANPDRASTELLGQKIVESFSTMVEMKINKMIDRKEVRRMKAAGVSKEARREFTADDVARKESDKKIKASMGPNNPKNTFKANPKRNDKYIEGGKKGKPQTPMTKAEIDRSGTGGKPAAGRPGQTKADVLDNKLAKIHATSTAFMANLAKNPKNSQK